MSGRDEDLLAAALNKVVQLAERGLVAPQVQVLEGTIEGEQVKAPVVLLPSLDANGKQIVTIQQTKNLLEEFRDPLARRSGQCVVDDVSSMVAHVNRFRDQHSVLFGQANGGRNPFLVCVLDYHETGCKGAARFGKHRTRYNFPLSDEWKAWTENDRRGMSQLDFASFIDQHLMDLIAPESAGEVAKLIAEAHEITFATQAGLLALSRGLEVTINQKFVEKRNLSSGEKTLVFTEEHEGADGQPLKIPGGFVLGIPVFRDGDRFQVVAQLRYRKKNGAIEWFYELYQPHEVFNIAFREVCETVKAGTSLPLLYGSPE